MRRVTVGGVLGISEKIKMQMNRGHPANLTLEFHMPPSSTDLRVRRLYSCGYVSPSRKPHNFLECPSPIQRSPGLFGRPDSPLPEDSLPRTGESITPQPLNPPSIDGTTKYMTHDGSASWHSTFNPLAPTPPGQHRLLVLHCACTLPLRKTPKTALTTQHRLNVRKFQNHLHALVFRSFEPLQQRILDLGDKRRLFGFTMPWLRREAKKPCQGKDGVHERHGDGLGFREVDVRDASGLDGLRRSFARQLLDPQLGFGRGDFCSWMYDLIGTREGQGYNKRSY
ncbi:uncharacterized protein LACBIDRAFT_329894 [Laccaria bicolor S238N-H82]|uniref:Predicted protein n=1 Tax=Laccaria bicolor (strain S238N-H82 / ATCC MYA-4686) TaxID=486041 RepID=B0DJK2_LACBS|nr:uncharacterized protein LACBIDRAFT_329894 [Laccaria bicolor S238N-H82]EDR05132.1 predicted protein [Laccaria bicolor S238N-H82]|eukprot:XP_001884097.1 predicted protein [Laccaria bicolor S238N-H82]